MSIYKNILKIIGLLFFGALGALIFNVFVSPYILTNPYFEKFQFVKGFKEGKIIINPKESVYIQENVAISQALQRVKRSIVAIQGEKSELKAGLIVTSDGLVVALAKAIPVKGSFEVFVAGESVDLGFIKRNNKNNLALIKINKNNLPTVGFAPSDKIELGQSVFLVFPTSKEQDNWLVNQGIIRELNKDVIKTSILEGKKSESSPLFNTAGELIGINFIDSENRVIAIPIQTIKEFLEF